MIAEHLRGGQMETEQARQRADSQLAQRQRVDQTKLDRWYEDYLEGRISESCAASTTFAARADLIVAAQELLDAEITGVGDGIHFQTLRNKERSFLGFLKSGKKSLLEYCDHGD